MLKKITLFLLTFMFLASFSVSATLAKNDKPKHEKNTPNKSERALKQQEKNLQKQEKSEKRRGPKGGPSGQNGRSFMGKLYFFEENPDPEDLIVEDEEGDIPEEPPVEDPEGSEPGEGFIDEENDVLEIAWGKMNYNLVGPYLRFVFNGHGLEVDTDYTLVYYPNYPEAAVTGLICLGSGTSDEFGDVHMNEKLYGLCDLPVPGDTNDGAQVILVLTEDVDCDGGEMPAWNPALYLFGYNLMKFDDTTCEITELPPEEEPEPEPEEEPVQE